MKALRSTFLRIHGRACVGRLYFFIIGWLPITMGFFFISPCLLYMLYNETVEPIHFLEHYAIQMETPFCPYMVDSFM